MAAKERIQEYLDYKGISTYKLECAIGKSRSYWANTKSISAVTVETILEIYDDLDPAWVITGKGSMLKQSVEDNILDNIIPLSHPKTPDKIYPMSEFNLYDVNRGVCYLHICLYWV